MEAVIYKHEANGEYTGIYAQIEDGKLTITEQVGEFGYIDVKSPEKVMDCCRNANLRCRLIQPPPFFNYTLKYQ